MWNNGDSHSLLMGMQNCTAILEEGLGISSKVNVVLQYNLAITLQGIYSMELKSYAQTKICT